MQIIVFDIVQLLHATGCLPQMKDNQALLLQLLSTNFNIIVNKISQVNTKICAKYRWLHQARFINTIQLQPNRKLVHKDRQ